MTFFKRNHNILALTHRKSPAIPHDSPLKLFNSFKGRGGKAYAFNVKQIPNCLDRDDYIKLIQFPK
jgi:hypothetical protein